MLAAIAFHTGYTRAEIDGLSAAEAAWECDALMEYQKAIQPKAP